MSENLFKNQVIVNGAMASSLESTIVDLSKADVYAVQAVYSGTPAGTLKLMVSVNEVDYVELDDSAEVISGAGTFVWEVTTAAYDKVKIVWTPTSGSGVLNVWVNGKGDWR